MSALPEYEVYAIKYAQRKARRADHFIGGDPHDAPMPMDYFVWAAVSQERSFVIDMGFTQEEAKRRKRDWLRCPADSLSLVGLDPASVQDVIISHMHYDHVGAFEKFKQAKFHVQEAEMHYATGRYMRYPAMRHSYNPDDVCGLVRLNFAQRVIMINGDQELAPGISLHFVGGHAAGMQCIRIHTRRGWVVLASDCSHYYENMETYRPFVTALHIGMMMEGYDKLKRLAPTPQHIVPGHDPIVMRRYPAPSKALEGIVARLDLAPNDSI